MLLAANAEAIRQRKQNVNGDEFKASLARIVAGERDVLTTLRYNIMPQVALGLIAGVADLVVRDSVARAAVRASGKSVQCLEPLASRTALEMYSTPLSLTHTASEIAYAAIHMVFLQLRYRLPEHTLPPLAFPSRIACACKRFIDRQVDMCMKPRVKPKSSPTSTAACASGKDAEAYAATSLKGTGSGAGPRYRKWFRS